ncbi:hypothetical protein SDC9_155133 [bioreactor metagenome]|uniref:Uncharacterized protein n=1 Tax=bioreactor metagenome TaxID=1076179 RepID=A0A645F0Q4_9ZZZZ
MRKQDARVCKDHGDGRAQFMGGIGHKAPLLFPGFLRRPKSDFGQEKADEEKANESPRSHNQGRAHQGEEGIGLPRGIREGDAGPVKVGLSQIAQIQAGDDAHVVLAGLRLFDGLGKYFIRHRDSIGLKGGGISILVQKHREDGDDREF